MSYEIFADYHQFQLKADSNLAAPEDFTDNACEKRILTAPGVITLMPERNMVVPVVLDVLPHEPALDLIACDHCVEGSIDLARGVLVITDLHGMTFNVMEIQPGTYRVRFSGTHLGSLSEDGLDGDDQYAVQLWPSPLAPVTVLKQYREKA